MAVIISVWALLYGFESLNESPLDLINLIFLVIYTYTYRTHLKPALMYAMIICLLLHRTPI
ncbi:hypothetical protein M378DRAFT_161367, partial [Amanita muscaria Koide BX008]